MSFRNLGVRGLASALGLGLLLACKSEDSQEKVGNGVDDIVKSCEIRNGWTKKASTKCIDCMASAPAPACGCAEFIDYGGLCADQGAAVNADPTCTTAALGSCTAACKDDCACINTCYASIDACRSETAARDGCVTQACAQYCE